MRLKQLKLTVMMSYIAVKSIITLSRRVTFYRGDSIVVTLIIGNHGYEHFKPPELIKPLETTAVQNTTVH